MRYTFFSAQRPLEGYTLKRALGRGGCGEVYFAISDAGKQVALKYLRAHSDVEMRGVIACLNLKHPHLVHLYDVRKDEQDEYWVIMEYIRGESLQDVLKRNPNGLPQELVIEWFVNFAKAVGHLHDHGIVHRDLKPGNIFIENGVVKVGDYGLSKPISDTFTGTEALTIVGTPFYMAPEIHTKGYTKQVDVYAAGVVLYEMLTGRRPFHGDTTEEIHLRHLQEKANLAKIPNAFKPIVERSLEKDQNLRFTTIAEMARAVEEIGTKPEPTPEPLKPSFFQAWKRSKPSAPVEKKTPPVTEEVLDPTNTKSPWGGIFSELLGSMTLATVLGVCSTLLWTILSNNRDVSYLLNILYLTVSASWLLLIATKFWKQDIEDSWARRLTLMGCGFLLGLQALWIHGSSFAGLLQTDSISPIKPEGFVIGTGLLDALISMSYFGIVFVVQRWWKVTDRHRVQRFSFDPIVVTAFWAALLLLLYPGHHQGAISLVMASAIVQLVSPWEEPQRRTTPPKRLRVSTPPQA